MSKRMGLGLVLFLMALVGSQVFAGPEPQPDNNRPTAERREGALSFEVFNTNSLLAAWTIICNNGYSQACNGTQSHCLAQCELICGGPCTCPSCGEQLPPPD